MKQISWAVSKQDADLIGRIVDRACKLAEDIQVVIARRDLLMDIMACHANGCRLNLDELLKAERFDFSHDVFGIRRHLNRTTGQLEDYFLPRYAEPGQARTA